MLAILIIFGWLIAAGCLLFLGVEAFRNRRSASRQDKTPANERELNKRDPLDGAGGGRTQNNVAIAPAPHPARIDYRRGVWLVGFVVFILWEIFWISEIAEYFLQAANPLQLPYFFLVIVMGGVPLAAYLLMRRLLRRTVRTS